MTQKPFPNIRSCSSCSGSILDLDENSFCGRLWGLILLFVLKNAYLTLLAYAKNRFLFNRAVDLSTRLFRAYLLSPYTFHLQTNSAALVRNVSGEVHQALTTVLMPTLDGGMELLVIPFIVYVVGSGTSGLLIRL